MQDKSCSLSNNIDFPITCYFHATNAHKKKISNWKNLLYLGQHQTYTRNPKWWLEKKDRSVSGAGGGGGRTWSLWCFHYLHLKKKKHYSLISHASKHSRHLMKRLQVFLHKQKLNSKLHQKNYREHNKQIFINAFYFFTYLAHIYLALIFRNWASPQKNIKTAHKKRQSTGFVET